MDDLEAAHAAEMERLALEPVKMLATPGGGEVKLPLAASAWFNVIISMFGPMAPGAVLSLCDKPLGRNVTWDGAETWQSKHPKT